MSDTEPVPPFYPLIETSMNTVAQRESSAAMTLKRRASSSFEGLGGDSSRKRIKEEQDHIGEDIEESDAPPSTNDSRLAEELAQELQCGCCSELVYKPVIVSPCQHFFCGRYCFLFFGIFI